MQYQLIQGDCLIESDAIATGSVDMVLTDLPYGNMGATTGVYEGGLVWDNAIEPIKIFNIANRILRKSGRCVLFAQEPYTTELITQALPNLPLNYRLIWEKNDFANALICNTAPVSYFEDIVVFTLGDCKDEHPLREYFKKVLDFIGLKVSEINRCLGNFASQRAFGVSSTLFRLCTPKTYHELIDAFNIDQMTGFREYSELLTVDNQFKEEFSAIFNLWEGNKYKSNILKYSKDYGGLHPTQKPILLLEDLIKTYTNEGDLVVDLTMGSASAGKACKNTNRDFIGIELDKNYYDIAQARMTGNPIAPIKETNNPNPTDLFSLFDVAKI